MSSSRIFRALMFLLACIGTSIATTSFAGAATTGPTGAAPEVPTTTAPTPSPGPVTLKVVDRKVRFGGKFRLRGQSGDPHSGQVSVQARSGGAWRTLRKVKTDSRGRFKAKIKARASTSLRIKTNDGRLSKVRGLTVIGRVKLDRSRRYVRLGRSLLVRGAVLPRGVRKVRLRVRGKGTVTTRTRANGRFRIRWKPQTAGDFKYGVRALPGARSTGDRSKRRKFSALRPGHASYYGPGLYGNGVACGGTLTPGTRGVAHKYLPCGTKVTLQYGGRTVVTRVIDRGPYIAGRDWDLTAQTRNDLGFGGVGVVWTNK